MKIPVKNRFHKVIAKHGVKEYYDDNSSENVYEALMSFHSNLYADWLASKCVFFISIRDLILMNCNVRMKAWSSEVFFQGRAILDFSREVNIGELLFHQLETKRKTFFY